MQQDHQKPTPPKRKPSSWGWRVLNWVILLLGFMALGAVCYFIFAGLFIFAP